MMRQTTVKNLPRTASVAGAGETKKGEWIEGKRRRYDKGALSFPRVVMTSDLKGRALALPIL